LKFQVKNEFPVIIVFSLLPAVLFVLDWNGPVRILFALPLVLFSPGYTLVSALFPKKKDLSGIERAALSLGLSIVIVPLLGLMLNYAPWGIRPATIWGAVFFLTAVMSVLALQRRKRILPGERFSIYIDFKINKWRDLPVLNKVFSMALIATAVIFTSSFYCLSDESKVIDRFTQFYVLGPEGRTEGYPREIYRGQEEEVILGIFNHEYRTVNYRVEVRLDGHPKENPGSFIIEHGREWEGPVTFSASEPREKIKVEFLLFKEGGNEPCCSLHLWVKVL